MCDTPTDVAVRIQSDYDDLVDFAREIASAITFEEESTLCDALGVDWESDE